MIIRMKSKFLINGTTRSNGSRPSHYNPYFFARFQLRSTATTATTSEVTAPKVEQHVEDQHPISHTVISLQVLKDQTGQMGAFFTLPDLETPMEGVFYLEVCYIYFFS